MSLPVFLLAIANERQNPQNFLKELPEEHNDLIDLVSRYFNMEDKPRATLDRIEQTFQTYGDSVRIFHFAGHAQEAGIQLEVAKSGHRMAFVEGLAPFIGRQKGVDLVFLNGCSTANQIKTFTDAGIKAVIATDKPILDSFAHKFAILFYESFLLNKNPLPLKEAFEEAKLKAIGRYGEDFSGIYQRDSKALLKGELKGFPYVFEAKNSEAESLTYLEMCKPNVKTPMKIKQKGYMHPYAHLLCGRRELNQQFEDKLSNCIKKLPKSPRAYVVQADEEELPHDVCARFHRFSIQKAFSKRDLSLETSNLYRCELPMPSVSDLKNDRALTRIKENFKLELGLDFSSEKVNHLTAKDVVSHFDSNYKVLLFDHLVYQTQWAPELHTEFWEGYLGKFWNIELAEDDPEVVLLFSFHYLKKKETRRFFNFKKAPVWDWFSSFQSVSCTIFEKLTEIPKGDVRIWNNRYAPGDPNLTDRIYKNLEYRPMQVVKPYLLNAEKRGMRQDTFSE